MQLYRVNALIISLVAQAAVTFGSSQPTFMYIKFEPTGEGYRYVRFYNDTFESLYNCMREAKTTQCNVKTEIQSQPPDPPQKYEDYTEAMQLYRVSALIIALVAQVTVTCVSSQSTFMYVRNDPNSVNFYRHVRFYNDTFQRLYNCMSQVNTTQCNVNTVLQSSLPPDYKGNDLIVQDVIFFHGSHSDRGYFTCQLDLSVAVLECTRSSTSQCGGKLCKAFRRRSSNCDTDCVYLLWLYAGEQIVFYETTDKFDDCKIRCSQTTNALILITYPSDASTLRPEPTPDATANNSRAPAVNETITSGGPPSNVALIIGVVCGVLCLVILVVAIGLIYRRHKQTKGHSCNNSVDSSRTHTNYYVSTTHISETKLSNVSNMPDVLSTLPHSSHATEKNGEPEDGYYTIDSCSALNRYENTLKMVSSKTSAINDDLNGQEFRRFENELKLSQPIFQVQGGSGVNSEISHTREGDYFILEPENNDVKDSDTDNEHNNMGCGYSLAKDVSNIDVSTIDVNTIDVSTIDVIDVSSPPKNVYSKFGNNGTDKINPYDMLLQTQGIHK